MGHIGVMEGLQKGHQGIPERASKGYRGVMKKIQRLSKCNKSATGGSTVGRGGSIASHCKSHGLESMRLVFC